MAEAFPGVAALAHGAPASRPCGLGAQRYPDPFERIRTLLAWAGFPARHDHGTPWYELAPQRLLLAEPTASIYQALVTTTPTPAQLDGASELFTCLDWTGTPRTTLPLPEPLASRLITHVESTATDPMKLRMRHGYGAGRAA